MVFFQLSTVGTDVDATLNPLVEGSSPSRPTIPTAAITAPDTTLSYPDARREGRTIHLKSSFLPNRMGAKSRE